MRRTIRKTFLLEGETVTMKYVKQLCGEERYGRMIEDAKKKIWTYCSGPYSLYRRYALAMAAMVFFVALPAPSAS